ncbi:uncharacterized protein LOC131070620 isoform X2 [Cryptomeria japonica]|uniref:uncharacterized protein LOC131070620 isoform X2 n=1 Tax=Cryptomeria japonica TaxID=3369 RepID=UPI0027DA5EFA|nr:uncharacterized protein LOC131070620 isoform X2 [Cryptomeria japonica]
MQGIKISQVGRIFALAAPSDSRGRHNGRSKKTKEERRVMIVSFVERYKALNEGKFPTATLTYKEVGGNYYTVREILQELKQENISCDTLGTDLEAIETKYKTTHAVEPLSLPAESEKNGVIGNHHSLEHKEANYQETLSDTEEKKIVIHNDVVETCVNNQTQANEGRNIVGNPPGSNPKSLVVDSQPLQGLTKGQSISSVSNGATNSNHLLELSKALSDPEEQGNIVHNDVVEICDPNGQTQTKQEINIGERPPRTHAASIARDLDILLQVIKGETASIGVRDNNHSLALDEAEYLDTLSDTEEQKTMSQNDVVRTYGLNDQTQAKQEIKIVESPQGPSIASVVGVQPLQEMIEGQSISSVTGAFMDNNHILEINEAKYQEALSDTEERKNIIHNDVETCGLNDQNQVKQEITIVEESPGTSAALNPLVTLEYHEEGEEHLHLETFKPLSLSSDSHCTTRVTKQPKDLSFSAQHEDDNDLVLNSTKGIAEEPAITANKTMIQNDVVRNFGLNNQTQAKQEIKIVEKPQGPSAPSVVGVQPLQEMMEGQSISSVTGGFTDNNHILEINEAKYQEALSDTEEKKSIIHNDVETCGLNNQTQVKQEVTISEESPGTSAASNPLVTLEYHEEGKEHLHLETSKPPSLSSDSHSTTCVTKQPKDLSFSVHHEDDNDLVLNSTKGIAEEIAITADKIVSPLTNSVTAPQEATEIPDNILDGQKLTALNTSPDQGLTGVKVQAGDASQKGSSEFQSEKLDDYSLSKYSIDLSDKETASVVSSSSLDQGGSTQDTVQSTQKTNSDGFCANNSEKKISSYQEESIGDTKQISHDLSDGNCNPTLENNKRTYKNTKSSKDREEPETNMVLDFVNNIVKGILYLWK